MTHGKLVVGNNLKVMNFIVQQFNDSAIGGHSGQDITTSRIKSLSFWKADNKRTSSLRQKLRYLRKEKPNQAALYG